MTKIKLVNATTGEEIERDMNAEELAQHELDKASVLNSKNVEATKALAKTALLEKLGITEDEARLLLG